jgi:cytochrome c oxidase subunit 4
MPHEPHGVSVPTPHHEVPYFLIFAALLVLTAITVAIAFIKFPTELINVLLALAVAFVKGSLVAMFFMHLKFEGKLIYMMVIIPLILCVLIICALIPDILMTGADSHSASLHLFNPPAIPK